MASDRVPIVLALLAGAVSVAHANPVTTRRTPKPWACPQALAGMTWASLAFPACPGYAYHAAYALPDDHPCKVTIDTSGAGKMVLQYRYDAQRRWVSESSDGELVHRCSYDGDHLAWCETFRLQGDGAGERWRTTATYDRDRLVRLVTDHHGAPRAIDALHYNDAGDIDTITTSTGVVQLDHDASHRLIAERYQGGTTRYTYDADRVAARNDERFTYDKRGRLIKVDDGSAGDAIAYDQRGRVATITSFGIRHTFAYCN